MNIKDNTMTVKTMNVYDELSKVLNVKLTDDYRSNGMDLEIGTWNTADGYELHIITSDPRNLEWEYDVYYYEPDFNTVIDRIKDVSYDDDVAVIFIADFDQYLPEYQVENYLNELKNEDENED
jgi:predicted Zn-dependent protease